MHLLAKKQQDRTEFLYNYAVLNYQQAPMQHQQIPNTILLSTIFLTIGKCEKCRISISKVVVQLQLFVYLKEFILK